MQPLILILLVLSLFVSGCSQDTKEQILEKGIAEVEKDNPNGAVIFFKNAIDKDPEYIEAHERLAKIYKELEKYDKSLEEYKRIAELGKRTPEIQLEIAHLLLATQRYQEAIDLCSALEKDPSHTKIASDALLIKGLSYVARGDLEKAEENFTQAEKYAEATAQARLEMARVSFARGDEYGTRERLARLFEVDPKNAGGYYLLSSLEQKLGNVDATMAALDKITEMNPDDQIAYYRKGMLLLDLEDEKRASVVEAQLKEKFPDSLLTQRFTGIMEYLRGNYEEANIQLLNSLKKAPSNETNYFLGLTAFSQNDLEAAITYLRNVLDNNPNFLQARLIISRIFLIQDRKEQAMYEALQAVKTAPKNALAHVALGTAYAYSGDLDRSLKEFDTALEIDPKLSQAHIQNGIIQLGTGHSADAEASMHKAVTADPENLRARLILYQYQMKKRMFAEAIKTMEEGLVGSPEDALLYNYMALAAQNSGNMEQALGYLDKAKTINPVYMNSYVARANLYVLEQDYPKAEAEYKSMLEAAPNNPAAYYSLATLAIIQGHEQEGKGYMAKAAEYADAAILLHVAQMYTNLGMQEQALQTTEKAIKTARDPLPAQLYKAYLLLSAGKEEEAFKFYEKLKETHPKVVAVEKIRYLTSRERFDEATREASEVINRFPTSADGYIYMAQIHEQKGNRASAITDVMQGLEKDENSIEAMLLLGDLRARNGDFESAQAAYDEFVQKYPDKAEGYYKKGTIYELLKDNSKAKENYRLALNKNRSDLNSLNNLAYILARDGNEKQALSLAIEAYRLAPLNPAVMDTLGYALLLNGYKDRAVKALEQASSKMPDNTSILYHLGMAYSETGNKQAARETLNKALETKDPDEKKEIQALLKKIG